jgi:hypothetical protein
VGKKLASPRKNTNRKEKYIPSKEKRNGIQQFSRDKLRKEETLYGKEVGNQISKVHRNQP